MLSLPKTFFLSAVGCFLSLFVVYGGAATTREEEEWWKWIDGPTTLFVDTPDQTEGGKYANIDLDTYIAMRKMGYVDNENTKVSIMLRNYKLRNKKKLGFLFHKRNATMSEILFPGVLPEVYKYKDEEDIILISTGLVESEMTHVPFDFYDIVMPGGWCSSVSRGSQLQQGGRRRRDVIRTAAAPFQISIKKEDKQCTPMCRVSMDGKKRRWMRKLIDYRYHVHMSLDGLPVLMRNYDMDYSPKRSYRFRHSKRGYPVGFKMIDRDNNNNNNKMDYAYYLYNHLKFTITYRNDLEKIGVDGIRITGFDVHPISIAHNNTLSSSECSVADISTLYGFDLKNEPNQPLLRSIQNEKSETALVDVLYSYDVTWVSNENLLWADRWDVYVLNNLPENDYRYGSFLAFLIMSGISAVILIRTLRKDIKKYQKSDEQRMEDETGWMVIHGDVFEPPSFSPMLLSVAVGTGVQIGVSFGLAVLLTVCHITNPMNKNGEEVLTSAIVLYVLSGSVAGYTSARIYKLCGGGASDWQLNAIATAAALPCIFGSTFIGLTILLRIEGAANTTGFQTIFVVILLWGAIAAPIVFLGAHAAQRSSKVSEKTDVTTTKTNNKIAARANIPEAALLRNNLNVCYTFFGTAVWFAPLYCEFEIVWSALWLHTVYYETIFLLLVLLMAGTICVPVGIGLCYLQLRAEDHRWWWKSFANCAMVGMHLWLYSIYLLLARTSITLLPLPVIVYLTYMSMISICVGLFCGSVGFLSTLWFVNTIYGAVDPNTDDTGLHFIQ